MAFHIYGYGQDSHEDQESLVREACANLTLAGRLPPDAMWCGFYSDESPIKTDKLIKFRHRTAGSMLLARLFISQIANNVLIVASHDRIFANVIDACETLELANDLGFRLLVLDVGLDTFERDQLLIPLTAMMKSLRQRERRRTKEVFRYRRLYGLPAGGKASIGWMFVRAYHDGKDQSYFAHDHDARRVAQFIAEHHDRWATTAGGTFEQTAYWLNAQKIYRPDGKPWRRTAVFNWYHAAKNGFPLPNGSFQAKPIPPDADIQRVSHPRIVVDDDLN